MHPDPWACAPAPGPVEDGAWAPLPSWPEDLAWSTPGFGLKSGRC